MNATLEDLVCLAKSHLKPYKAAKSIDELQRQFSIKKIIKLGSNENPLGASPKAIEQLHNAIPLVSRYPDPTNFNLRTVLSEYLSVDSEQLIVGNGSSEILSLIAQAFICKNDEVIIPEYSFALFEILSTMMGATCRVASLQDWCVHPMEIINCITSKTKMIFIANPNNPTGTCINQQEVEYLLKNIPNNIIVVFDEAYYEYCHSGDKPNTVALLKDYPNLIITRTFSKAYALAGLRLGYGIASSQIIAVLNLIKLTFNFNVMAIMAAIAAIKDEEYLQLCVAHNRKEIKKLECEFNKLNLSYISSHANFITFDLNRPAKPVYDSLLKKGIITRTLENYNMPNHLSVTIGLSEENDQFLLSLKEILL